MARIRSIHPGQWTDEDFVSCSPFARLLAIALRNEADDQGIFEWKPIGLKMKLFPADAIDINELLAELVTFCQVAKFDVEGKIYGALRNFCRWQRPKSPQILYPCPDEIYEYVGASEKDCDEENKPERGTALGKILHERQGGRCHYCESEITFYRKKPNSLEIDHCTPVSLGGSDSIENLCAACKKCNSLKANMTEEQFRNKFSAAELRDRHKPENPKSAKIHSLSAKKNSGENPPQMEDVCVGGNKEDSKLRSGAYPPESDGNWLWSSGVAYLTSHGISEKNARSLVGKWRKSGDSVARAAFDAASNEGTQDPVPFIEAILKAPRPNGRHLRSDLAEILAERESMGRIE